MTDREDENFEYIHIQHVVTSEDLHYGVNTAAIPAFTVEVIDNDEWSADVDGAVSVDWDGILATYALEDGAVVQTTDVSALINSMQGNDFKVEVFSRIVETSPGSALLVANDCA